VHSYGWYMKNYAETAKAKGALPILVSPIPRNMPSAEGKFGADTSSYSAWSEQVAKAENVPFVALNAAVVDKYNAIGAATVKAAYFPGDHTHTSPAGAELNAQCVIECLKALQPNPLAAYLSSTPPVVTLPAPATTATATPAATPSTAQ
jgi:lysophospholipase L1-like esterase